MAYLRKILAIVGKDIVAELRTKEMFSAMFVFAVLVVVIFTFAFDLRVSGDRRGRWRRERSGSPLFPGAPSEPGLCLERTVAVWMAVAAPVDHTAIYFGKMLSTVLFMLVVEALMLPVFTAFFGVNLFDLRLLLVIFLGTVGFASVGTVLSAMTAQTRAREVLLPILLLPVAAPVLIAAVKATAGVLDGLSMGEMARWLQLLIAFDVIFPAVAFMTFDYVVKE
jgi:heme exporter protein B